MSGLLARWAPSCVWFWGLHCIYISPKVDISYMWTMDQYSMSPTIAFSHSHLHV
ncbi:hypothetical protein PIIN_11389 [Serendipita indica DSM 11827]|uniref:Uncharacterized protein n=1 Tax=Serendipita indica (strain DSM 11827) TaxID=1109443 RepID=G4U1G9_SERID|nr:hypothetical protein PIIN_11389 [Serendipita indica DSM 11827]